MASLYNGEIWAIVDTDTGQVRSFHDGVLSTALSFDSPPLLTACVPQETAIARAAMYLRLAGVPMDDLVLRSAELIDAGQPADAASRDWVVRWQRVWRSVPFADQPVVVTLDAGAGRLLDLGAAIALRPPAEPSVEISQARAAELAQAFLVSRGMRPSGEPDVELKIVTPTDFWNSSDLWVRNYDPNTRLAWIVRIPGMMDASDKTLRSLVVWVDAITGKPLGGDVATTMAVNGRPVVPGMEIGALLRKAIRLEARSVADPKAKKGSAALSPRTLDAVKEPLTFYGAVSGIVGKPEKKPATFRPTHRLVVHTAKGPPEELTLDARSGLLANTKGEALRASPTLWAWLRPQSTVAPIKPANPAVKN